jgi:hypothetical protein
LLIVVQRGEDAAVVEALERLEIPPGGAGDRLAAGLIGQPDQEGPQSSRPPSKTPRKCRVGG